MSQENVEILSAMYEAFNRRDFEDALRYWTGGVALMEKLAATAVHADAVTDDLLTRAIRAGLKARLGLQLGSVDLAVLRRLRDLCSDPAAPLPSRIAVCERCAFVFEPSRKAHATFCRYCEKRPSGGAPGSNTANPDGSFTFHDIALGTWHLKWCECCHQAFMPIQKTARFCPEPLTSGRADAPFYPGVACCKQFNRRGSDDPPTDYLDTCYWESDDQRAEYEQALAEGIRTYSEALTFRVREAVINRPGPRLTREDALAERHESRRRA